ncbi:MAG: Ig-like domain-containing protein, partial [Planctomycetes bacterium]|nr:Ig-like domain-containing protein [Planctomycetota bacterium]
MKKGLLILFTLCTVLSVHASGFQYVSPKPDAIMVSAQTNIIFRHSDYINSSKVSDNLISVIGSKSGIHEGEFILSDDAQTILFNPYNTFADNEVVTVQLREGLKTLSDSEINAYSFSFTTAPAEIVQISAAAFVDDISLAEIPAAHIPGENEVVRDLPAPPITINSIDNPSPGYIFMATWDRNIPHLFGNFIFVLDSNGAIVDSVRIEGAVF